MTWFRIAWATVAVLLVSYAALPSCSQAATQQEMTALYSAYSTMKLRVITTRYIVFWDAVNTQPAKCWQFFVPKNVATPPKGQGFYANQWTMQTLSTAVTEEQCYALPAP